jgi:hypothetical protein
VGSTGLTLPISRRLLWGIYFGWFGCLDFQKLMEEEINKELRFFYFKKVYKKQTAKPAKPATPAYDA